MRPVVDFLTRSTWFVVRASCVVFLVEKNYLVWKSSFENWGFSPLVNYRFTMALLSFIYYPDDAKGLQSSDTVSLRHTMMNMVTFMVIHGNNITTRQSLMVTICGYLFINIKQLDALNFIISLFQISTCFEHKCSEHVEIWNKLIIKFSASSWLILINKYIEMHGQQNIESWE